MGLLMGLIMDPFMDPLMDPFMDPFAIGTPFKQRPERSCEKPSGIKSWRGTAVFFNLTFNALESRFARDCDLNNVPDSCDIAAGALDENSDGRIDACNYAAGDFDLNNNIDSADLGFLLIFMGEANPPFGDFDTNGFCDSGDVGYLLLNMGPLE